MNANKVFRANARAQLGGSIFSNNWLMALVAALIYSAIMSFASSILVGGLIVGGFLTFGFCRVFLLRVRNQKEKIDIADLFSGGEHFGDLLVLNLLEGLFIALWMLLFIIPGVVKAYAYSMAFYIKHDHPEYNWKKCLDESQRYMKGHKWQLFCLDLSFIGWILIGVLTCGIGLLWVTPYECAARANFYENLRAIYEPETPAAENTDAPEYSNAN